MAPCRATRSTWRQPPPRSASESAVAGLTGVRNIKDDIEIAYDADPFDVTLLVQDALDRYALIPDDSDVAVDTRGNTVTLAGRDGSRAGHLVRDLRVHRRGPSDHAGVQQ